MADVEEHLGRWVEGGVIDQAAAGRIREFEAARDKAERAAEDERAEAANWTTGDENYYLQSIDVIDDFIPEDHLNAKVHAKGYLILQPNRERINLTALEVLADRCQ